MNKILVAFVIAVLVFIYGVTEGLMVPKAEAGKSIRELKEVLERLGIKFKPFDPLTAIIIFLNNAAKSLLSILLGITVIVPLFMLYVNGYIIGSIFKYVPLHYALLGILPHGIIELPAFITAAALGVNIGLTLIAKFLLRKEYSLKREYKASLKTFKIIAMALLIAAFIETYITPLVVSIIPK